MRAHRLRDAGINPEAVISDYEQFKRDFQPPGDSETTERQCQSQGFVFLPMVVESHSGGWGKAARQ
eukprot:465774-Karenia_brevis.AAC.1